MSTRFLKTILSLSFLLSACSPKVYLVDRQTVLEEEAAGEWPSFEEELIQQTWKKGPTPLELSETAEKKRRLYHILNGEMTDAKDSHSSSR